MPPDGLIAINREMGRIEFRVHVSLGNLTRMKKRRGRLVKIRPMGRLFLDPTERVIAEISRSAEAICPIGVGAVFPADGIDGDQAG